MALKVSTVTTLEDLMCTVYVTVSNTDGKLSQIGTWFCKEYVDDMFVTFLNYAILVDRTYVLTNRIKSSRMFSEFYCISRCDLLGHVRPVHWPLINQA